MVAAVVDGEYRPGPAVRRSGVTSTSSDTCGGRTQSANLARRSEASLLPELDKTGAHFRTTDEDTFDLIPLAGDRR